MQLTAIEGIVRNGQIQLPEDTKLPESAKVYIVITPVEKVKRVMSPRLVDKSKLKDFEREIIEIEDDEI